MLNDNTVSLYNQFDIDPEIDLNRFPNIVSIFTEAIQKYQQAPALSCMGRTLSFDEFDRYAQQFAAYLHQLGLQKGDRIAVMLPNVLQQPVAVFGILRAGFVLVNTNPLYTARELEHQLCDSGAKAVVVLANMAAVLQEVLAKTQVEHVILTEVGDMHPPLKRTLINAVVKHVKKAVPKFNLPKAVSFNQALKMGSKVSVVEPLMLEREDIAALQYTGGTTGLSKGAVLTHGNLLANCQQIGAFMDSFKLSEGKEIVIQPLPLYHIYAFTMTLAMLYIGAHNVLIPNPRDLPGLVKELAKYPFSVFCGLNTLFVALLNNEGFRGLNFSRLNLTVSGGMALTQNTAEQWEKLTGKVISEGYGLTEASPVVTFNPGGRQRIGSIGIPLPLTQLKLIDDNLQTVPAGDIGELCVRGPQVMRGYWQNVAATASTIVDGWLLTGDIAQISEDGYVRIVDRKKDMILVSGFNVYPNEIEDQLSKHPDIVECAAVGVPDQNSGEVVKLFVVKKVGSNLRAEDIITFARDLLTAYKIPKIIEFRDELPKSNVGKILRRHLRE